jgi:hypothetical protein
MANITYFFALAFSRTEEGEARAEAAIKALDEEHAISMAARLGSGGRGAVALAKTDVLPVTAGQGLEILARFGEVPDDRVLIRRVSDVWASGHSYQSKLPVRQVANAGPTGRSLVRRWLNGLPLAARRQEFVPRAYKRSLAMTWVVAVALSLSGGAMLIITAKAGQRESRLMEMARPACTHTAITNEELRRFVRNEYNTGTDKQNTLRTVVALCQANPRML